MRFLGIFIALLVAFGSLMPHAAPAHSHTVAVAHDMGKSHPTPTKDCTDCAANCIGCAAPVQLVASMQMPPLPTELPRARFLPASLTAFVAPLELPPPRLKA